MKFFGFWLGNKDDGICLRWKCPKCEQERDYRLVESQVQMTVAGLGLDAPNVMLELQCTQCGYELRVPVEERALVEQARDLTRQFRTGQLMPGEYAAKIEKLPARFVKDLLAMTKEWKCVECGEGNPITFGNCWKCQSKQNKGAGLSEDAQPLPGFRTHTNPWDL